MSEKKHTHGEAFKLMTYQCNGRHIPGAKHVPGSGGMPRTPPCGHKEVYWNSRDGVTPFGKMCPSCGGDLTHIDWRADRYAPDHKPFPGQGIWRDGTPDEAEKFVRQRFEQAKGTKYERSVAEQEQMIADVRAGKWSEFQPGWPMFYRHDPSQEG